MFGFDFMEEILLKEIFQTGKNAVKYLQGTPFFVLFESFYVACSSPNMLNS